MSLQSPLAPSRHNLVRRHPALVYFLLAFAISWTGALSLVAARLLHGESIPKSIGLMMFPLMLLGPSLAGILLTMFIDGRAGLRDLFSRMLRLRAGRRWFLPLLIPPVLICTILFLLKTFASPIFAPNLFLIGILFGLPAGLLEEIGWSGFAFPNLNRQFDALPAGILLGIVWGIWHLPVVGYLGSATAAEESLWYWLYAAALWLVVSVLAVHYGKRLSRQDGCQAGCP
jgi:membrane protease YdiL (CAAX protease family)